MDNVWMGTSGFSYKEWKPSFYPKRGPTEEFSELLRVQIQCGRDRLYVLPDADGQPSWFQEIRGLLKSIHDVE